MAVSLVKVFCLYYFDNLVKQGTWMMPCVYNLYCKSHFPMSYLSANAVDIGNLG